MLGTAHPTRWQHSLTPRNKKSAAVLARTCSGLIPEQVVVQPGGLCPPNARGNSMTPTPLRKSRGFGGHSPPYALAAFARPRNKKPAAVLARTCSGLIPEQVVVADTPPRKKRCIG